MWRPVAWAIIAAQVMLPLGVAFAPAGAASVAASVETPAKNVLLNNDDSSTAQESIENKIAGGAMSAGHLLTAQQSDKAALGMARSALAGGAGQYAKDWFDQFGTVRLQLNLNERFKLDNSALDLLVPLYENQDAMVFSQWGIRNKDHRNTGNIGGGVRTFHGDWMYGLNTFYDNDFTGKNRRAGIGAEAWTHYLKLSANSYFRLSNWRQSRDFEDYNERPANGYDLRAEAFLPSHPQLGGKLMYESYRGDEVALFGKNNRQKNPDAFTLGLNYTPFPLLTLGGEHRQGKSGQHDSRISLQINYRLGESWLSQVDPSAVAAGRTLAGSRYDLVERNNHIVLDYKKQEVIRLLMPEQLNGKSGQLLTIAAQVTAKHGLDRVKWDAAELIAAGGAITQSAPHVLSVTLPPYLPAGSTNQYTIGATAYDKKGNASNPAYTQLTVTGQGISLASSPTTATPDRLTADGISTSLLSIILRDDSLKPVSGMADALTMAITFEAGDGEPSVAASAAVSGVAPVVGDISETAVGVYSATLTAGSGTGRAVITPMILGQALKPINVILEPVGLEHGLSTLDISSDNILADGTDHAVVTFSAKDVSGNLLTGLGSRLVFDMTPLEGAVLTDIVEDKGSYSSSLKGTQPGKVTITPILDGVKMDALAKTITLRAALDYEDHSDFSVGEETLTVGDGSTMLSFSAKDESGEPVKGLAERLAFIATPSTGITISDIVETDGNYTARLSGTVAGKVEVAPSIDGKSLSGLVKTVTLAAGPFSELHSVFSISGKQLNANDEDSVELKLIPRDEYDNITTTVETIDFHTSPATGFRLEDAGFDDQGAYVAKLFGTVPGDYTITPSVGGHEIADLSQPLILLAVVDETKSALDIDKATLTADNTETATLTFSAKDSKGQAVTGLGARLVFSASPAEAGVIISPHSESDGTYTAIVRGTKPGSVSLTPKVDGVEFSTRVKELTFTAASIDLKITVDKEVAKAGEQIMLTVDAMLEDGTRVGDVTIDIHSHGASNRQNRPEIATLLINGESKYEVNVPETGQIRIPITDPTGKGVKTTVEVTARGGKTVTKEVIFTVATSPDVPAANYYGHMAEFIDAIQRPRLASELTGSGSARLNNENWAVARYPVASPYCTLPSFTSLEAAYGSMRTNGWPLSPGGFIWSGTASSIVLTGPSVEALNSQNGQKLLMETSGANLGFVACAS
ncbi:inverse autotransporter beta domain-containing protein [Sodalis ligni]|uniref:inverse autotransporter beta domain-containing protein n=1 Tax=Sodalis ligni TaxID=2697027 RepID=UPI001BDEB351|nr:inverse autotransporter beta domain-containing protein [Sodalis ligni]QWA10982.1 inverse autotransporter beta domain-containing protein [Sodalis ligni]